MLLQILWCDWLINISMFAGVILSDNDEVYYFGIPFEFWKAWYRPTEEVTFLVCGQMLKLSFTVRVSL